MIVRSVDGNNDWNFGKGRNDYKRNSSAVAQLIKTNLLMFLGECFFATNQGVDWFNLLGAKDQTALKLAINTTILNTTGVSGLVEINYRLSEDRAAIISYSVDTIYGRLSDVFEFDIEGV